MRFSLVKAALAAALGFAGMVTPALASNLEFHVRSEYPYQVSLEFYSLDRNHVWPGNGKVYILDDSATHNYNLSCNYGEKICFGAWVRGDSSQYWGGGLDNKQYCSDCCYTCGYGDTPVRVLNE
ncbi:MAG: hypothetical protein D6801_00985 [Alphaproteobacteria bacterium]|nr:MAG: hypothetical protein D6801_00985 [Alphaproteobacteria bacterium]